jgi:hypothetical protein
MHKLSYSPLANSPKVWRGDFTDDSIRINCKVTNNGDQILNFEGISQIIHFQHLCQWPKNLIIN